MKRFSQEQLEALAQALGNTDQNVNRALSFAGLAVEETGKLVSASTATTLSEAERRARDLRADLEIRDVHPDVLKFCDAELLADNYFHAVLEATKSIADKLRSRTGLIDVIFPSTFFNFVLHICNISICGT